MSNTTGLYRTVLAPVLMVTVVLALLQSIEWVRSQTDAPSTTLRRGGEGRRSVFP